MTRAETETILTIECQACKGRGRVADWIGLEMNCVEVECWLCRGTGREPADVTARKSVEGVNPDGK